VNLPVHAKAWTALIGSLLTFIVPFIVQQSANWPEPWPAIVGIVVALLTFFGVYRVPNQLTQKQVDNAIAKGHVVVPDEYKSPWPKP